MKIPSNPEHVCFEHGLEFWTGLLTCVKDGSHECPNREALHPCDPGERPSLSGPAQFVASGDVRG
jgi:hypothetical protein